MKPGRFPVLIAGALALLSLLLALLVRLDAAAPPDFVRFLGRFHTLAVHLPIGILLLIALAELASFVPKLRARVDPAIGLALPVVAITGAVAFVLGLMLARGGGYPGQLIMLHRGLTLASIAMLPVCALLWARPGAQDGGGRWAYRGALSLAVLLMSVGAHYGGSMTQGEHYLVRYAPGFVRGWFGVKEPVQRVADDAPVADPLVWEHTVLPILKQHCEECHGESEAKGSLRVDSVAAALKGGDEGPSIVPGKSHLSSLVTRMQLPLGDDERMPPDDKPGPSEAEIALIAWWIDRGATEELKVREGVVPQGVSELLAASLKRATPTSTADAGTPEPQGEPQGDAGAGADTKGSSSDEDEDEDDEDEDDEADSAFDSIPYERPSKDDEDSDDEDEDEDSDEDEDEGASGSAGNASGKAPVAAATQHGSAWKLLIAPLLDQRCGKCHGEKRPKGKFRVDSLSALTQGAKEGPGVVPRDPGKSTLITRIRTTDPKKHMPPYKHPQVTASELELLIWWVGQGAGEQVSTSALSGPLAAAWGPKAATRGSAPAAGSEVSRGADGEAGEPDAGAVSGVAGAGVADGGAARGADEIVDGGVSAVGAGDAGVASSGAGATGDAAPVSAADGVLLYRDVIAPILVRRCGACHSGANAVGVDVTDLPAMIESGDVVPGEPEASPLLARQLLPLAELGHMPPKGEPQPEPWELEVTRLWIRDGAGADLRVARADLPPEALEALTDADTPGASGVKATPGGGCAACTVGRQGDVDAALSGLGALLALSALWWRRRGARRCC
ncbi:MAG: hypothetical protein KIT72_08085 [Polyangiaceae bacterium]|nr:hypothetical protein [Polyangiaceae bacterium]MCW5790365.1 hypothetical protein [Polyangiaceae bacterium]